MLAGTVLHNRWRMPTLADAVVSGGNANEVIELPPMDKIIGHVEVADVIAGGFDAAYIKTAT